MKNELGHIAVLGAGPAGIAAAWKLGQRGLDYSLYEQRNYSGGLCHSFAVDGYTFDTFVHFSFTENPAVRRLFDIATPSVFHPPESRNYWKGHWLRHPVQNNLYDLPVEERVGILCDFVDRPIIEEPVNYEEWLRTQYGNKFAEEFPMQYNKKYWCTPCADMETKWVGVRMSRPGLREVLRGAMEKNSQNNYYAKEMRYPDGAGYQMYLQGMADSVAVQYNKRVIKIDPKHRIIQFSDQSEISFCRLISTLPLPDMCRYMDVPDEVSRAADSLQWTCGVAVSIGLKRGHSSFPFDSDDRPPAMWLYLYDKEYPAARIYFPHRKSPKNVPEGCASLQAEVYFPGGNTPPNLMEIKKRTVDSLVEIGLVCREEIVLEDIRFEPYANVVFTHNIYRNRQIILDFLRQLNIVPAGRFGRWDYLWSDQSIISGWEAADYLTK